MTRPCLTQVAMYAIALASGYSYEKLLISLVRNRSQRQLVQVMQHWVSERSPASTIQLWSCLLYLPNIAIVTTRL